MTRRGALRRLALAAIVIAGVAARPGVAAAHAELRESNPPAGARLETAPTELSLQFTESVALLDQSIRLLDAKGQPLPLGTPSVDGSTVTVDVPSIPEGGYVVDWRVVSADGHPVAGAFTFTIGDAPPPDIGLVGDAGAELPRGKTGLLALWRAFTYAGLAIVLGTWLFVTVCWPGGRREPFVAGLTLAAAATAAVAATARLVTERLVLETSLADTIALRSGRGWLALIVLGVAGFGVVPVLHSALSTRGHTAAWAIAALATGLAIAYAGHGANGRLAFLGTALTVVHVAAVSAWVGGLIVLARVLRATRNGAGAITQRFSRLAGWCVALVAATGIAQSVRVLKHWGDILHSDYGVALLVKLAVVVLLVAAGAASRQALRRQPERVGRTVGVELGLAVVVFGVTGWLAGSSPAATAVATGPVAITVSDTTGAQQAELTVTPARAGTNLLHLVLLTPAEQLADEVEVHLAPVDGSIATIDVDATDLGSHIISDPFAIPFAGDWTVTIEARYGNFDLVTFEATVPIAG